MLTINIPSVELFDDETQTFLRTDEHTLKLEHSLISISKWESKWCKPFLSKEKKSLEETIDYIKCMTINKDVDSNVYNYLSQDNISKINNYIDAPMTATTFSDNKKGGGKEIITSELIYYWMIALNIPMECQRWHLNRLLTLIRVCNIKNTPPKKMSRNDVINKYASLNASRRKQLNSNG